MRVRLGAGHCSAKQAPIPYRPDARWGAVHTQPVGTRLAAQPHQDGHMRCDECGKSIHTRYIHYQYPMGMRSLCRDCKRKLESPMSQPKLCDLCGAPNAVAAQTGTLYCAQHEPGILITRDEWNALSDAQRERRLAANRVDAPGIPGAEVINV